MTPQSPGIIAVRPPLFAFARGWLTYAALGLLVIAGLIAASGPFLPHTPTAIDLRLGTVPPMWQEGGASAHPLGTDDLGRDILARLAQGIQISMLVAVVGTLIGAVLGTVIGLMSAHFGGLFDEAVVMGIDVQSSIPFTIFALAILAFFSGNFLILILVVGIDGWERYARLSRSIALSSNTTGAVAAVRALGLPEWRIYLHHLLPACLPALAVQFTLNIPSTILLETTLSFLGIGIQPPVASLGRMLGDGRDYLMQAPWICVVPGVMIFLLTLAVSILGDGLRDRLDPSLR